ncbi:MAG TPA: imidazolonepropionase [Ktedonobacterales bacterium]|jgi:imidazolonepropionase|nr:imidazolonepropionase [Ktedonobacterales bacterium]
MHREDDGDTERLSADVILTGAGRLVTLAPEETGGAGRLGVIERGALAGRDGRIVWVGAEEALARRVDVEQVPDTGRINAGGRAVLPGFVDSHTHFIFAGNRAEEFQLRHAGVSYEELARQGRGILSTVCATRAASDDELRTLGRERLLSFAAHGTTTVEGKTGYGLDMSTEARCLDLMRDLGDAPELPTVVPTFLGAHTIPPEFRRTPGGHARYVDLLCEEMLPAFAGRARFCDAFCEQTAFSAEETRRIFTRARELGYALKLHANQLSNNGAAAVAAEFGAVSADHLDFATDTELDLLRAANVTGTLLPGCSFSLSIAYPSAQRLYEHGVRVALATDFNPGTSYCEDMQMMLALAVSAMGMTLEEALLAVTLGGAHALGMEHEVGSLEPGKRCDLIILRGPDERELAYHFGVNLVAETIVGGRAIFITGEQA